MSRRKLLKALAGVAAGFLLIAVVVGLVFLRPARIRSHAEQVLSERLRLDVEVGEIDVSFWGGLRVAGAGVEMRIPNRPELPPFVSVDRFDVSVAVLSGLRARLDTIELDGLTINVPPGDAREGLSFSGREQIARSRVVLNRLEARNAILTFVQTDPDKRPLTFAIHELVLDDLGFTRPIPFEARLTNPVPRGLIESTGVFGPYNPENPTALPVSGAYTLTDADLSTINGIGGILQSDGSFDGLLTDIAVEGRTSVPDFNLDLGGRAVPLDTTFVARVDGTNGTTRLERVDATILDTRIIARGAITNLPGPGRHDVAIESEITEGRIEDMLALAIDSPQPLLTGDLTSESTLHLPPGEGPVRTRLRLTGRFGLGDAEFTDAQVQEKIDELSRRGLGQDEDEADARVLTALQGTYTLADGIFALSDLAFLVPGAEVSLEGTYDLGTEALDLRGELRTEASASSALGGIRGLLVKPLDFIFRRDGAGAVVPISVTGTWREPKANVNFWKIFG